jgi:DNA-binding response OmpR family regulator
MKLLIVEDEQDIRDFLKVNLDAEMFTVDTAEDGETGSYLARTNNYDVIILDNVLPKKSGAQICQELRKSGKTTPIIMLSVQSEPLQKIDLLNIGADDYLTKPFTFGELLARIRAVLRRPQQLTSEILQFEDLSLDLSTHKVFRGKKEIYLTRKEFELLEYLLRHRGSVVTRGALIENIWDMHADPFSNTIETHILNLRRKVDAPESQKLIQTVPGRGYKVDIKR